MSSQDNHPSPEIDELKWILENVQTPEVLNRHPWTNMRIVSEAQAKSLEFSQLDPGARLLEAVADAFEGMMPSMPPRHGLRLDTRWGEFGLLAARYFAPLKFGTVYPASLREAWGRIDPSILLFMFGSANGSVSAEEKSLFRLVGNESEVAPISTLSNWHTHGIGRLAKLIREKEARLQQLSNSGKNLAAEDRKSRTTVSLGRPLRWIAFLVPLIVSIVLLSAVGLKAYRVFVVAQKLNREAQVLIQDSSMRPSAQGFGKLGTQLDAFDQDLSSLRSEVEPYLWLGPHLGWVPGYGGDISQAGALLDLAQSMTASAREARTALMPTVEALSNDPHTSLSSLSDLLGEAGPQLLHARLDVNAALAARGRINPAILSGDVRKLLTDKVDPTMTLWSDGLTLAIAAPSVLGGGNAGPKTYLLVAQNEDELRPSGGFITAVGKLVLDHGKVVDLSFEDSGDLDNWAMPYPMAPWQLNQYMNSPVLILRDANWFPDFPTAALYVQELYAYTHQNSVDGIVAFDQHALVMLLQIVGSVQVESVPNPITADNVVEWMRVSKSPPAGQPVPAGWNRKGFMTSLGKALLQKILTEEPGNWPVLGETLLQAMNEHHVLLKLDNQDVDPVLAGRQWNGALQSNSGDFLMVVDSNVGFNKTNAVVQTSLAYDVNLTDLENPVGELLVSHANHARSDVPCIQWSGSGQITGEEEYPIDRCYWDYMRIYIPVGTRLLSGTPQSIPPSWMILNRKVPAAIDVLDEGLRGLGSFGTLIVVPGGEDVSTSLKFALPPDRILASAPGQPTTYDLTVRKQPGTLAVPLTLRIHLPTGSKVELHPPNWIIQGPNILIETDLRVDLHLDLTFSHP